MDENFTMDKEEFEKHGLKNHVYIEEINWKRKFSGFAKDNFVYKDYKFGEVLFNITSEIKFSDGTQRELGGFSLLDFFGIVMKQYYEMRDFQRKKEIIKKIQGARQITNKQKLEAALIEIEKMLVK